MENTKLSFEIFQYNIHEKDGNKFVLYDIKISTAGNNWCIQRRYTELLKFRKKITQIFFETGIKSHVDFPGKMIFKNLDPLKIEQRRNKLENFLNKVSTLINLYEYPDLCDFLEIGMHTRRLLSALDSDFASLEPLVDEDIKCDKESGTPIRMEKIQVYQFLKKINYDPFSIAKAVSEFEEYYYFSPHKLFEDEIRLLLIGDKTLRGLLYMCGEDRLFISGCACMQMLGKLLKFEYNPFCSELVAQVLGRIEPSVIKHMNLSNYRINRGNSQKTRPFSGVLDYKIIFRTPLIYLHRTPQITIYFEQDQNKEIALYSHYRKKIINILIFKAVENSTAKYDNYGTKSIRNWKKQEEKLRSLLHKRRKCFYVKRCVQYLKYRKWH